MTAVPSVRRLIAWLLAFALCFAASSAMAEAPVTVRVACNINQSLYLDLNGELQGFCADFLTTVAQMNGWQLQYVPGTWSESLARLQHGELDLLLPTQYTEERAQTLLFSEMIGGYQQIAMYANATSDYAYDDAEAFGGATIAVSEGSSNETALSVYAQAHGFTYTPLYIASVADKLAALKDGRADLAVFSTFNVADNLKLVGLIDVLPFYFAMRDPVLMEQFNSAMRRLLVEQPSLITGMYFQNADDDSAYIAYTAAESAYLAEHPSVRVGFYLDTAPLCELHDDGEYTGVYIDFLKMLEESTGMAIELVPIERPVYGYDLLQNGDIDLLIGSSLDAVTTMEGVVASDPFMDYSTVMITGRDYRFGDSAPRFAMTAARRYWEPNLRKQYPDCEITYYPSAKDCLNAVRSSAADATELNTLVFSYQSRNPRYENLIEWENLRELTQTVLTARADTDAALLNIVNKGIRRISSAELEASVYRSLNAAYHSQDLSDTLYNLRYVFAASMVLLLLGLTIILVINQMHRRTVRAFETKNRELAQANRAKTAFLSRISHELRTPLNVIMGLSDPSVRPVSVDTVQGDLSEIHSSADALLGIVNGMLDIADIDTGRIRLACDRWHAEDYLRRVLTIAMPQAKQAGVRFSVERPTHVADAYLGDGLRVQQILMNLLSNAFKFTPKGGEVKLIAQSVAEKGDEVTLQFTVTDTGVGMSPEFVRDKLFSPFTQEDDGSTSPYEGAGIGLSLSRRLARLMGGDVICQSEKGRGTTFVATIVVRKAPDLPDDSPPDWSGRRVLLCEDHPLNRKITEKLLTVRGAQVDMAENGRIGVERFAQSPEHYYDLVLMDIRMPEMDGLQATRAIRALPRADVASVPIIAVSANAYEEDRQKSLQAGMNAHLAKPIDTSALYTAVADAFHAA